MGINWRPDHQGVALRLKNAWAFGPHVLRPAYFVAQTEIINLWINELSEKRIRPDP